MRFHRPNVLSCKIGTGHTRTLLVDAYLPPLTLEHLPDFKESLQYFKGMEPIIFGYLNVDLDKARSLRRQQVVDLPTDFGLIDLFRHLRQRHRFWDLKT